MVKKESSEVFQIPAITGASRKEEHTSSSSHAQMDSNAPDNGKTRVYGKDLNSSDMLLSPEITGLIETILESYGIGEIRSVEPPSSVSTTSRKAIITTDEGQFFLKEKPSYSCTLPALKTSATFQDYLSESLFFIPKIVKTTYGEPFARIGSRVFFLTEYCPGRLIIGNRMDDLLSAGAALGMIHAVSSKFEVTEDMMAKTSYSDADTFLNMAAELPGSETDEWRNDAVGALRTIIEKSREKRMHVLDQAPQLMNHGDFAPFNMVFDHNGIIAVNDFDNAALFPRVRDLADAVITFGNGVNYAGHTSSFRRPVACKFDVERARVLYEGYQSKAEPFSQIEQEVLINEIHNRWVELMALGLVRGDFNYFDILQAMEFPSFVEEATPLIFE